MEKRGRASERKEEKNYQICCGEDCAREEQDRQEHTERKNKREESTEWLPHGQSDDRLLSSPFHLIGMDFIALARILLQHWSS